MPKAVDSNSTFMPKETILDLSTKVADVQMLTEETKAFIEGMRHLFMSNQLNSAFDVSTVALRHLDQIGETLVDLESDLTSMTTGSEAGQ